MKNTIHTFASTVIAIVSLFTATACAQARAQASNTVSFSGVPASFTVPAGWKVAQKEGDLAALVPNIANPEVVVVVRAGMYKDAEAFYSLAAQSLRDDLKIQNAQIVQNPSAYRMNGMNASSAIVSSVGQDGQQYKIGLNVVFSANGVGLGVVAIAPAAKYQQGVAAVEAVMQSARFGTITFDRQAAAGLVGRWYKAAAANSGNRNGSSGGWSSGSNVYYTFNEDGTYYYSYESFASVDVPGMGGLSTSKDEDSGRYYVSNGQVTLVSNKKGSNSLTYRVVDQKYIQIGNGYFARR
ncbi:MAG TPA: lipocalin family protein [Blastocatellia bacterium]|nr:lipocalin family protein [Blastocatellia bacterium]